MATDTSTTALPERPSEALPGADLLEDPLPPPPVEGPLRPAWQERDRRALVWAILLPVVLTSVAGALRFYRLAVPERCYFDETYYYYDARDYLANGVERDFAVHPPVGKWLIGVGLAAFGVPEGSPLDVAVEDDPGGCTVDEDEEPNPAARAREAAESFARRVVAAVFGTATVLVTYFAGVRLFRRRGVAALAALLLAIDGLALTMSRIAMLDVFLAFFVVLGFHCLLIDRDRLWEGAPSRPPSRPRFSDDGAVAPPAALPRRNRTYRWLAGVSFGLALATKWSAILAIGAAGLFLLVSELVWRYRWTRRPLRRIVPALAGAFLALVTVPAVVYVASYAGWFANIESTRKADVCAEGACDDPVSTVARIGDGWWDEQGEIYRFHRGLEAEHPYRASAWGWLVLARPVAYYYESCSEEAAEEGTCDVAQGNVAEILGIGNPAIWWLALLAWPVLLWCAWGLRDWAAAAIGGFLALQYVPWLLSPRPVFLFYMTPVVPFLCLGLGYVALRAMGTRTLRWAPATIVVLAVAAFLFWYPLLVGLELPRAAWDARIWVNPGWI